MDVACEPSVRFEIKVALGGMGVFALHVGDGIPGSNIPGCRY
jgi:hypothetical protein